MFGHCESAYSEITVAGPNFEGDDMFGKLSFWISALVLVAILAPGGYAQAAVRKTNMMSNVRTHIIPN